MRKLRVWCNLSRWPRATLMEGKHPVLTWSAVRKERLHIMRWAWENQETLLYSMLYNAHKLAGCPVNCIPAPAAPVPAAAAVPPPAADAVPPPAADAVPPPAADAVPPPAAAPGEAAPGEAAPGEASAAPAAAAAAPDADEVTENDIDWDGLFGSDGHVPLTDIDNEEWQAFVQRLADGED